MSNNHVMLYNVQTSTPVRIRPDTSVDCAGEYKEKLGLI